MLRWFRLLERRDRQTLGSRLIVEETRNQVLPKITESKLYECSVSKMINWTEDNTRIFSFSRGAFLFVLGSFSHPTTRIRIFQAWASLQNRQSISLLFFWLLLLSFFHTQSNPLQLNECEVQTCFQVCCILHRARTSTRLELHHPHIYYTAQWQLPSHSSARVPW